MSDITPAVQKVLTAIKASYGGAVSIAAVHGWRFTGEAGEGGWPVSLLEALRQYGAEQRQIEHRTHCYWCQRIDEGALGGCPDRQRLGIPDFTAAALAEERAQAEGQ